jgi:hypothetical protein
MIKRAVPLVIVGARCINQTDDRVVALGIAAISAASMLMPV